VFIPNNQERQPIHFHGSYEDFRAELQEMQEQQALEYKQLQSRKKYLEKKQHEYQQLARQFSESGQIGQTKKAFTRKISDLDKNPLLGNMDLSKQVNFGRHKHKGKVKKDLLLKIDPDDPLVFRIGEQNEKTFEDFSLYVGQSVRLTGANGSGKSTLLKSLQAQIVDHTQANFPQYVSGKWVLGEISSPELFVLSQITDYPESLSLSGYILENTDLSHYVIPSFLKKLELQKFNDRSRLSELSLGEFIRLQLGLLSQKIDRLKLIILDEPGNYLDVFTQTALVKFLADYKGSLLLVTHDDLLAVKIGYDEEWGVASS
jgi:ATPase subunit of ABC transporter with duplicated ATPase domains